MTFGFCTLLGLHRTCHDPFIHLLIWKWGAGKKKIRNKASDRNCLMYAESWNINNFWMAGVWDFYSRGVSTVAAADNTKAVRWRPLLVGSRTAAQTTQNSRKINRFSYSTLLLCESKTVIDSYCTSKLLRNPLFHAEDWYKLNKRKKLINTSPYISSKAQSGLCRLR